jgi:nucleoside-triphosphatase THEP1
MAERKRFIITGVQGSGKTTFCQSLIDLARSSGWKVAGVLSPPIVVGGKKVGIDVVDLSSNQRRHLANNIDRGENGPKTIRWAFDGEALSWGNRVLGDFPPCDLLVIDELGPLEFDLGEGWLNGIPAVSHGDYKLALIVIRPGLVEKALELWPGAEVIEIDGPEQADTLSEKFFRDTLA